MCMKSNSSINTRFAGVDVIRVLAMVMVVFLHTVYNFTVRTDFFSTKAWFLFEPVAAISKTGVLLFFMISGYLVIQKRRSIEDNWNKTVKMILIPLAIFTIFNFAVDAFKQQTNTLDWKFVYEYAVHLINFPSSSLWFLVALFFMYSLNPLWQVIFSREKGPQLAIYLTTTAFLVTVGTKILDAPLADHTLLSNIFTGWLGFIFFYLYGGLVRSNFVNVRNTKLNLLMVVSGFLLTIFGDYQLLYLHLFFPDFAWTNYLFGLNSLPVFLIAIGLFNVLISSSFNWLNRDLLGVTLDKVFAWLAGQTYGIYLIHTSIVAMLTLFGFSFDQLSINVYLYNIFNFAIVLGASLVLVMAIKKTPLLKMAVGE